MIENISPWITQLKRDLPIKKLSSSIHTDIAIVGGGIAGMTTAYFLLAGTHKKVALIEADKIAHGATGHNAGQVVHYFEKPFSEIVEEYGIEMAAEAQNSILSAWDLLSDIVDTTSMITPIHYFTGYAGCTCKEQVLEHLENKYLRHKAGINIEEIMIAENATWLKDIPERYKGFYSTMSQDNILSLLETEDPSFIAVLSTKKAVMNSALFTEELARFLLKQFSDRFTMHEMSPVKKVILEKDKTILETEKHTITAEKTVLCTNGFSHFSIENKLHFPIDTRFHHNLIGVVGYMAGYIEPLDKTASAISYFTDLKDIDNNPIYYYLTRRPFEMEKNQKHNLVCIGGPEVDLVEHKYYVRNTHIFKNKTLKDIDGFLKKTYKPFPKDTIKFKFHWHGLMGYTRNLLRLIGKEPCNSNLLYNLGCNGVGILPSIYGGKRIADILKGKKLKPSVFDPVDTRCMIK